MADMVAKGRGPNRRLDAHPRAILDSDLVRRLRAGVPGAREEALQRGAAKITIYKAIRGENWRGLGEEA